MIGGASDGMRSRVGAKDVVRLPRLGGAGGRLQEIQRYAAGIGRATYRSVAPCPVFWRKPGLKRVPASPLRSQGWLDHAVLPADWTWAAPMGRRAIGNVSRASGLALGQMESLTEMGAAKRIRLPSRQLLIADAWRAGKPAFMRRSLRLLESVAGHARGVKVIATSDGNGLGLRSVAKFLPSVAPIRVPAETGAPFHEREKSGSWLNPSSLATPGVGNSQNAAAVNLPTRRLPHDALSKPAAHEEAVRFARGSVRRAVENFFAEQVRLPPSGFGGFDPRLTPAWAGLQIPG